MGRRNDADVVNLSLGGEASDGTDPLSRAIDELSASTDTLFVVAAGNSGGPSTITSPGAAKAALTVGAVDDADAVAWFSSRGPRLGDAGVKPDVAAPGVSITAARAAGTSLGLPVDDYYTDLEGTSMATPHVAGIAAILKDQHPDWDGERIKAVIAGSTVPVANATAFEVGTGLVDAARAIGRTVVAEGALDLGFFAVPAVVAPADADAARVPQPRELARHARAGGRRAGRRRRSSARRHALGVQGDGPGGRPRRRWTSSSIPVRQPSEPTRA